MVFLYTYFNSGHNEPSDIMSNYCAEFAYQSSVMMRSGSSSCETENRR